MPQSPVQYRSDGNGCQKKHTHELNIRNLQNVLVCLGNKISKMTPEDKRILENMTAKIVLPVYQHSTFLKLPIFKTLYQSFHSDWFCLNFFFYLSLLTHGFRTEMLTDEYGLQTISAETSKQSSTSKMLILFPMQQVLKSSYIVLFKWKYDHIFKIVLNWKIKTSKRFLLSKTSKRFLLFTLRN